MSIATWYASSVSAWTRHRHNAPQQAMGVPNGGLVIDMNSRDNNLGTSSDKKQPDSLFGPNIGVVNSGPTWTAVNEKKMLADELTQDIVKTWIEKSKETNQPTTTLQALVNLKRPTLRLSPLQHAEDSTPDEHDGEHLHGLEFEYDCDAPKCGIYVHVLLSTEHPDAPASAASNGLSKLLVFESVVEGGFDKVLKLEEGATLELGRFEHVPLAPGDRASQVAGPPPSALDPVPEASNSELSVSGAGAETAAVPRARKRFTHFSFRKHHRHNRSVSGPALAVVDAEPASTNPEAAFKSKEEDGVKVTIRLVALDAQGTELESPNEQVTYFHVVRFGEKKQIDGDEHAEDTRPWVVRVVKREATIGPHTFHLHEIYGLNSSSHHHPPTAPLPDSHSYPPVNAPVHPVDDEPSSECLLCLSSPREVVLLPCRHLVACKDCALNMVEFGAGGTITQAEEPVPTPAAVEGETTATPDVAETTNNDTGVTPETAAPAPATPTAAAPTPSNPRRKRKAKGWFCPVCRQPYTSLLRITTSPPPPPSVKDENPASPTEGTFATGASAGEAPTQQTTERSGGGGGGFLGSLSRPAFLRGFSSRPVDLEAQTPGRPIAAN